VELPQARAIAIDLEIPVVAAQLLVQLAEEIAHPAVVGRPTPWGTLKGRESGGLRTEPRIPPAEGALQIVVQHLGASL